VPDDELIPATKMIIADADHEYSKRPNYAQYDTPGDTPGEIPENVMDEAPVLLEGEMLD
jgi:hypothetical protein